MNVYVGKVNVPGSRHRRTLRNNNASIFLFMKEQYERLNRVSPVQQ